MACKSEREAGCGRGGWGTSDLQPTLSHDDDAIFSLSPSLPPTLLSPPQLSPQISMQSCRMMHANKSSRLQSHHCHLLVLGSATYYTYHMAITITMRDIAITSCVMQETLKAMPSLCSSLCNMLPNFNSVLLFFPDDFDLLLLLMRLMTLW